MSPVDGEAARDDAHSRKCLSPVGVAGRERSRSVTPFFPILDNIKETTLDTSILVPETKPLEEEIAKEKALNEFIKESKLSRPKSYPIKSVDTFEDNTQNLTQNVTKIDIDNKERTLPRESKLVRPRSYPASSPSPEKVYVNRNLKKEAAKPADNNKPVEGKTDVEVSFSITLPRKSKSSGTSKTNTLKKSNSLEQKEVLNMEVNRKSPDASITINKYQVVNNVNKENSESKNHKRENGSAIKNGGPGVAIDSMVPNYSEETKLKVMNHSAKKEEVKLKSSDPDSVEKAEKKGVVKKKVIKKVSSKSKTDVANNQETTDAKTSVEKKKVTKKLKDKVGPDGVKATVTKKKSVLQSIGHKLEKFATKSSSPEKVAEHSNSKLNEAKKESSKLSRLQREQSVPVSAEPPTESNLIKRAVTLTDVAALDTPNNTPSKTTVSKVLGLFKKFDSKDKSLKSAVEKLPESIDVNSVTDKSNDNVSLSMLDIDKDKPRRPTSLLLNGLGRKKYGKTSSDSSVVNADTHDQSTLKKENDSKTIRNSLKLDFSRLPRVKKIVPTNPVIEPIIINVSSDDKDAERKDLYERNGKIEHNFDPIDTLSRSRSRSRSAFSNSEVKSELSADIRASDRHPLLPTDNVHHPLRNHESTSPDKEDIVDRIRRKSFYSRFNEKKLRRKSSLVGPGAVEYDPVARLHSQQTEAKFDASPTSPAAYDLSPGYSIASDLSPSTERYRSLLTDLPSNARSNLRYENYGLNDKIDTYRSLDRNEFRKYPTRNYLDYDQPSSYGAHRYSRTRSLLDSSDNAEDHSIGHLRDPLKYNRTLSMYSPGNYATYRPKRIRNSAIILKESEKEPSPENILDKIRQRKIHISVTRKADPEKGPLPRSDVSPKGEGDSAECSEKTD